MAERKFIPRPTPALAELMRRDSEAEGRPFGGWGGEWLGGPAEPASPPLERLRMLGSTPAWSRAIRRAARLLWMDDRDRPRPARAATQATRSAASRASIRVAPRAFGRRAVDVAYDEGVGRVITAFARRRLA